MRQRYEVFYDGKRIGSVHAQTAFEAIQRVCKLTGHDSKVCTARSCTARA